MILISQIILNLLMKIVVCRMNSASDSVIRYEG